MGSYNTKWPGQSFVLFMAWAYLAFVIYGSLVPLSFHPELAQQRLLIFLDPAQFSWRLQSKADIATNALLTMPLVFLWSAVITDGGRRNNVFGALLALIGSVFVSLFVEWAQIFFLPRDPSLVDILSQLVGSCLSCIIWIVWGRAFLTWLAEFSILSSVPSLSVRLLILYLVAVFAYGLVPLDLTLSLTDFYRKFRDGKVLLIPFLQWRNVGPETLYGFITDIILWVPVGLLGRLSFARPQVVIIFVAVLAAALLECLQLFVLSRVSDSTQVVAAAIGAFIGIKLVQTFSKQKEVIHSGDPFISSFQSIQLTAWTSAIGWIFLLCLIFWYPYDFQITPNARFTRDVLGGTPLEDLFYQSELRALTELLRKTLFFAPLGFFCAWAFCGFSPFFPKKWIVTLILLTTAGLIEAGKFFLPGKFPSGTNVGMEITGGWMGYWSFYAWQSWQKKLNQNANGRNTPSTPHFQPKVRSSDNSVAIDNKGLQYAWFGLVVFVLGTFLWIATKIPQVPYNFRNLPNPSYPYFSMVLIGAALVWSVGFPFWIARKLATSKMATVNYPFWLILFGLIAWILTYIGVEPIRAYKIVGSPILHWPWHFEWLFRFLALMAAIGSFAVLGCVIGGQRKYLPQRLSLWLLHAIWLLPFLYWVIIVQAATDNIVELLAWSASPVAAFLIFLVISNIFFAASKVHHLVTSPIAKEKFWAFLAFIFSFPIGYWLLLTATEPVIIKYDKVFSGIQFILSSDRSHYAQSFSLVTRYLALHFFLVTVATLARKLFVSQTNKNQSVRERAM